MSINKTVASLSSFFKPVRRLALLALIGSCSIAVAQTAPQLLPYTSRLIAGSGTVAIALKATCPVSGLTSTDAYGDGCLATEIQLTSPRAAVADVNGNIFFSDYANGLVRRVDAVTGVVTAVAGGAAASPAANSPCVTTAVSSLDALGDNCLGTAVKLSHPAGLVFSPAGDLYFSDIGYADVRKIAASGGIITNTTVGVTTTTGVISLVDGNVATTFGYTSGVSAATASYLQDPYGLAFDKAGNLYIADEYTKAEAILVVNTNATGSTTVAGVTIPAGQVVKIVGSPTGGGSVCPNSPAATNGCNFGVWTDGSIANASQVDGPYAVALDPAGNVYFSNEFNDNIGKVTTAGIISNYAGIQASVAKVLKRGPAGSFAVGSSFGIVGDSSSNIYFTDASSGVIWRVDGAGQSMYVVAGGATTLCTASTDTWGDGCPALQAKFGSSGTSFASTTAPGPGIFAISVDAYSDLFVGDTVSNLIREVASGTQFGTVGANQPTQIVDIHFGVADTAASASAYTLTAGSSNFALGTATCTVNSDNTTDCLLPLTATPSVLGPFTGTLQVQSKLGGVASFALSGIYVMSPFTRTSLTAVSSTTTCTGTTYATTAPITITATVASSGSPTGTVTFFANGAMIGTPQTVTKGVATLTFTFSTPNTYNLTATYSGDSYFKTSTTASATTLTTSAPTFTAAALATQQNTVTAGQSGLYSFNLAQNLYSGTISMSCSGLPANASCVFSPSSIAATGCSTSNTVALTILTQSSLASQSSLGSGRGPWGIVSLIAGFGLALAIGLRRRQTPLRLGALGMIMALLLATSGLAACGSGSKLVPATPSGSYNVTVTATGSTGVTSTFAVPLTVK